MGCSCEWKSVVGFLFHLIGDGFAVLLICIAFGTDKYILIHFHFSFGHILIHFDWQIAFLLILIPNRQFQINGSKWLFHSCHVRNIQKLDTVMHHPSFYPNKPNRILNVSMFLISKCINIFMVPHSQLLYHHLFTSLVSDLEVCTIVNIVWKIVKIVWPWNGLFSHLFVFFTLKCNISNV